MDQGGEKVIQSIETQGWEAISEGQYQHVLLIQSRLKKPQVQTGLCASCAYAYCVINIMVRVGHRCAMQ